MSVVSESESFISFLSSGFERALAESRRARDCSRKMHCVGFAAESAGVNAPSTERFFAGDSRMSGRIAEGPKDSDEVSMH